MIGRYTGIGRKGNADFSFGTDLSTRMFLSNGSDNPRYDNDVFYPEFLSHNIEFTVLNSESSSLGQNPDGTYVSGWNPNARNLAKAKEIVNAFPRRMLQDLVLVPGKDGSAVPIAGAYFIKLMDHIPGTVEPLSCLITDENGDIAGLTITGNISLNGDPDGDTAINTLGKNNQIDCGSFGES
jgi:hypothetical protein